jgi:hypothetical protein
VGGGAPAPDRAEALPVLREHVGLADALGGDPAVVDVDDVVGLVLPQTGFAIAVYGVLHARAPAERAFFPREGLDFDARERLGVEAADARQLLDEDGGLEAQLRFRGDVLEVAAAAFTGPGPRAGRLDAVGRRLEDLDGVGEREALLPLGDLDADALAGQRMAHEVHLAVDAGHAVAARGDVSYGDDHVLAPPMSRCRHVAIAAADQTQRS